MIIYTENIFSMLLTKEKMQIYFLYDEEFDVLVDVDIEYSNQVSIIKL